jgi:hypothetical protein
MFDKSSPPPPVMNHKSRKNLEHCPTVGAQVRAGLEVELHLRPRETTLRSGMRASQASIGIVQGVLGKRGKV